MFDYDGAARERRVAEPAKRAGSSTGASRRGEFQRDRARVLHSYAFRRLADKTQVVVPGEDDFPRTRLTHSLEVAQIGREIGAALGCDPDLVDAAGLAHDIGHPPFGHNGEDALDAVAGDCGGFEANAQTLRVLTRLEPKVVHDSGEPAGLNLTRAALDATCKYPWPRRGGSRKFGVYDSDAAAFAWARAGAPPERRCLEAQVMDWADDVAYSVHDVEDGVHGGFIRLSAMDEATRAELCRVASTLYSPHPADELAPVLEQLLELPTLRDLAGYDGSYLAQAAAKRATSELTGRFAGAAVQSTRAAHGTGPLRRYRAQLVVPGAIMAECALLKAMAAHYVMCRPGAVARQEWQRRVLTELVQAMLAGAPRSLDPGQAAAWRAAGSEAARLRVVIDQIAQLTDSSAVTWHARLTGGGSLQRIGPAPAP
ncbi:MAG: deoxyguanosinetriphosphate triphosphohydrolase [Jatrophihabitantaceae bacterium]